MHSTKLTWSIRPVAVVVASSTITSLASLDRQAPNQYEYQTANNREGKWNGGKNPCGFMNRARNFFPIDCSTYVRHPPRQFLQSCACEEPPTKATTASTPKSLFSSTALKPLSRTSILMYRAKILSYTSLPTPRRLSPLDPIFSYPELKRGLKQRQNDEKRLQQLLSSPRAQEARQTQDQQKMNTILDEMNSLVHGKGVTPQIREDFLMQYGCTGYTHEILDYLVGELGKDRGFVEIGAGNGQWARALTDHHNNSRAGNNNQAQSSRSNKNNNEREFVLAYDSMKDLPLSPQIYHNNTVPAKKYFYNVRHCTSHIDAVQGYASRGRVLLLVYPPPGPMALETAKAYLNANPENNTIVYVGEGIGGANTSNDFFEYFLGKDDDGKTSWAVVKVMDVLSSPGGKGYEKMFVLRKVE